MIAAVKRDLEEFARSYEESHEDESDSVFMRVIKESLWQELADITDKTQLEWREVFQDLNHHGVYHSGEVVGLGNPGLREVPLSPRRYTPRTCCRAVQNVATISSSVGPSSPKRAKNDARGFAHRGLSYFTVLTSVLLKYCFPPMSLTYFCDEFSTSLSAVNVPTPHFAEAQYAATFTTIDHFGGG